MNIYKDNAQEHKNESVSSNLPKKSHNKAIFKFDDKRPQAVAQLKLQSGADDYVQQQAHPVQKKGTGGKLPDNLKNGIENLSGLSMDDVNVHYNSNQPAQLQAHAYAQGTNIHIAPGQEKHLPHEAWHVVQQKQGRVKATLQLKGEVNVNDDKGLEHEADVMGAKGMSTAHQIENHPVQLAKNMSGGHQSLFAGIVQRNLTTKSSLHGDKVDGSMPAVRTEVTRVINENKNGEVLDDIGRLQTSIASRKAEQATFKDKTDPEYIKHAARITNEEAELARLQVARIRQLANRPKAKPKPQADADGWTTV
ncbi:eCIS core domain-containing protein [Pedobacter alluvionis]|uniref:Uncharacterized protein DUF4157 n=1 Tax=Pedobacter alluvionis TaxID=475253 RepID=A0A497YBS6_9SPHI|nr:DUF4157 domain-containing protein [Pedobacter alluvionis]RLJ80655.1 uncharacterized protein DUF4157 [Pedobacter alluvionis]